MANFSQRKLVPRRSVLHRCHSEITILRTKLSGKCGVGQLVMTRPTALCVVARPDPSRGGPNGGSGSCAIRALPDFCSRITSNLRLGVMLIFPPDHSGTYLEPRFERPGLSLTLCRSAGTEPGSKPLRW